MTQRFSTEDCSSADAIAYWTGISHRLKYPVALRPIEGSGFAADIRSATLGRLSMAQYTIAPSVIAFCEHAFEQIAEPSCFLLFQTSGTTRFSHGAETGELGPGELALFDSRTPFEFVNSESLSGLTVRIPVQVLDLYVPDSSGFFGLRIDREAGAGNVLAEAVRHIWELVSRRQRPASHSLLEHCLLSALGACLVVDEEVSCADQQRRDTRLQQVRAFIDSHLGEADLGPDKIARAFGMSERQLRRSFERERETITQYILRRRLCECAERLASPHWKNASVTQIAFSLGFNSLSHFSRTFRGEFGEAPTAYRRSRLSQRSSVPV